MQESKKRLVTNTLMLYVLQISKFLFPLITFPYITRTLGSEKYGVVILANSIISYFSLVIDYGFLLSGTNSCSLAANDKKQLSKITFGIIQAKLLLAILSFIVLAALCCSEKFKTEQTFYILSFIGVVTTIFLPDFLFRGLEKMKPITYRVLFSKLVYTVSIFLLIKNSDDYLMVPIATILANIVAIVLTWIPLLRDKWIYICVVPISETIQRLKESSLFFLSRIATTFYSTLNTIILGVKYCESDLGQYGVANTITTMGKNMLAPISDSIYPYMLKKQDFKLAKKILLISEPIIIVGCLIMWFIAEPVIVFVCGEEYKPAAPLLKTMLPLIAIALPDYICGYPILGALGQMKWANNSVIAAAVFHVLGLTFLYLTDQIGFMQIITLTILTQIIELAIRVFVIIDTIKKKPQQV